MQTLKIGFKVSGTRIFIPFMAICSVTNKEFSGDIIIEYQPYKVVLEYVDTGTRIKEITKQKLTVEELANLVFLEVKKSINPKSLKVTIDVKQSQAHTPVVVWIEDGK